MDQDRRQLVAILAADVVGYSRLMAADESGTLARLKSLRSEVIDPKAAAFRGRLVGSAGDSVLIEFPSATDAVRCAVEMQELVAKHNADMPPQAQMCFRVGVNLGDVLSDEQTIYGDGVNIAARLEKLSKPGEICVSRSVYDQVRAKLPVTFVDMGEVTVHNIPSPVHAYRIVPSGAQLASGTSAAQAARETTSVAILPFLDMSPGQDQGYLADGITEDLITELARFRHLSVVARTSTFAYKGRSVTALDVGRELNADFVVEGSVRQAGGNLRVTVQLIDARTGGHAWAERFDRSVSDIFAIQDEIVLAIVARLHFNLDEAAALQRQRDPTASTSAYTCFLRALAAWRGGNERAAIDQLQEAIRLDPNYARALAQLAFHYAYGQFSMSTGLSDEEAVRRTLELSQRALAADTGDPQTLRMAAIAQWLSGEPEAALRSIEAAVSISPHDIDVMLNHGTILAYNGRYREGLALIEQVNRSEPRLPPGYRVVLSDVRYLAGDYEGAVAAIQMIVNPPYYARVCMAASLAQAGRIEEAKSAVIENAPANFDTARFARRCAAQCALESDRQHVLEGFRKAGIAV
jgi:TolB-like protein/class 3 adenylate cyclase/Tfp pilus assembly protein PilF